MEQGRRSMAALDSHSGALVRRSYPPDARPGRSEQQPSFDAAKYKNAQREQWNKDGAAWRRWTPTLERWYGVATRQMLDLADLNSNPHSTQLSTRMRSESNGTRTAQHGGAGLPLWSVGTA